MYNLEHNDRCYIYTEYDLCSVRIIKWFTNVTLNGIGITR